MYYHTRLDSIPPATILLNISADLCPAVSLNNFAIFDHQFSCQLQTYES